MPMPMPMLMPRCRCRDFQIAVIDTTESFNNFLLEKTFLLSLYQTNLTITGLGLHLVFGFPILCVLSISLCKIFISILAIMTFVTKTSVFSWYIMHQQAISPKVLFLSVCPRCYIVHLSPQVSHFFL